MSVTYAKDTETWGKEKVRALPSQTGYIGQRQSCSKCLARERGTDGNEDGRQWHSSMTAMLQIVVIHALK